MYVVLMWNKDTYGVEHKSNYADLSVARDICTKWSLEVFECDKDNENLEIQEYTLPPDHIFFEITKKDDPRHFFVQAVQYV